MTPVLHDNMFNDKPPFYSCESYLHHYAKKVFVEWFSSKLQGHQQRGNYFIFDWKNDGQIFEEYPIWIRTHSNGHVEHFGIDPIWQTIPNYDEMITRGFELKTVVDLMICDGSRAKYVIEVVHTHPTPPWKIQFLQELDLETYEISAGWIMNQVQRPSILPLKTLRAERFEKLTN